MTPFSNPHAISDYAENSRRLVPGLDDFRRICSLILAERVPEEGRILVVGAGGGLELKAFAEFAPRWRFDGVDPSAEMLQLAETTLGPHIARVQLHQGFIDAAPDGPFDGASCLLTLHFTTKKERLETLKAIHRRLKPGAPFVAMHFSFGQENGERDLWLSRYAAFAATSGVDPEKARQAAAAINERLTLLSPEQDEQLIQEAGLSQPQLIYTALAFRGWVTYAKAIMPVERS